MALSDIDVCLAAALREPQMLTGIETSRADAVVEAAARHGVAAVLRHRAAGYVLPSALATALRSRVAAEAAAAAVRDREAVRVLGSLARGKIQHAVIKGLALAYTVYPQPWMRPRSDTDLLVKEDDLDRLDRVFRDEGYELLPHVRGDLILPQRHFCKTEAVGEFRHNWDVHWRMTSSHVLSDAPPEEEVWEHLRAIDALGSAQAPAAPHALMIACIHRLAHHHDDPRLIWLWDIRLLLEAMPAGEVNLFAQQAARHPAAAAACGRSLTVARDLCGATIPPGLMPLLEAATEPSSAAFLWSGSPRRASYLLGELRSMPAGRRLRALRQHVLPSLSSMRERYPGAPGALLPLLYPWRLLTGVPRWLAGR